MRLPLKKKNVENKGRGTIATPPKPNKNPHAQALFPKLGYALRSMSSTSTTWLGCGSPAKSPTPATLCPGKCSKSYMGCVPVLLMLFPPLDCLGEFATDFV